MPAPLGALSFGPQCWLGWRLGRWHRGRPLRRRSVWRTSPARRLRLAFLLGSLKPLASGLAGAFQGFPNLYQTATDRGQLRALWWRGELLACTQFADSEGDRCKELGRSRQPVGERHFHLLSVDDSAPEVAEPVVVEPGSELLRLRLAESDVAPERPFPEGVEGVEPAAHPSDFRVQRATASIEARPRTAGTPAFRMATIFTRCDLSAKTVRGRAYRVVPRQKSAMLRAVSRLISGQVMGKISVPWMVPITCRQLAGTPARSSRR